MGEGWGEGIFPQSNLRAIKIKAVPFVSRDGFFALGGHCTVVG
jgi:hypothetical protein